MTMRFLTAATVVAIAGLLTSNSAVFARERLTYAEGKKACDAWCTKHNSTSASRNECWLKCYLYWSKNGSDRSASPR